MRGGALKEDSMETRGSVAFMAGTLITVPLWNGVGVGFGSGSPSSAQGHDGRPSQQEHAETAWDAACTAAIPGITWANWKTSPRIRVMVNLIFTGVNICLVMD